MELLFYRLDENNGRHVEIHASVLEQSPFTLVGGVFLITNPREENGRKVVAVKSVKYFSTNLVLLEGEHQVVNVAWYISENGSLCPFVVQNGGLNGCHPRNEYDCLIDWEGYRAVCGFMGHHMENLENFLINRLEGNLNDFQFELEDRSSV